MSKEKQEEYSLVMEQNVFGELDINDPSKKKINRKSMEELIKESIEENRKNL